MRKHCLNLVIFRTLILLANLHILFGLSKRKSRIFTILANILYLWRLYTSFLLYLQVILTDHEFYRFTRVMILSEN